MGGRRATHDVRCRPDLIPWLIAWLMLAWSFGGTLLNVALTCFTLPVCLFTQAVICVFEQTQNWLRQEVMIVWTIGKWFLLVLACLFSQAIKCLHWMMWIMSCVQISFSMHCCVGKPLNTGSKDDDGVGAFRGHSRSSRRAIVFPAVCVAGARRRLRFLKRKFATQGIRIMHLYCMHHAASTFVRPEKQKTIRNTGVRGFGESRKRHDAHRGITFVAQNLRV